LLMEENGNILVRACQEKGFSQDPNLVL